MEADGNGATWSSGLCGSEPGTSRSQLLEEEQEEEGEEGEGLMDPHHCDMTQIPKVNSLTPSPGISARPRHAWCCSLSTSPSCGQN